MSSINNSLTTQLQSGITIDSNTANQRMDRFLRKLFRPYPDISLVMIFKAIRTGQIKIIKSDVIANETKWSAAIQNSKDGLLRSSQWQAKKVDQSYSLKFWDTITFHESFITLLTNKNPVKKENKPKKESTSYDLSDFQSRIISEDDDRLVINKPAGISIHPGQNTNLSQSPASLYDFIKQYYSSRGFAGSMFQPNVAYRLDKDTSWLVIVAKTYAWLQHLNTQIREHKVDKLYYTILVGTFPKQLTMTKPMKKIVDKQFWRGKMVIASPHDELAQNALTTGYNEKSWSDTILWPLSLVKVKLETGRMHQIRVHCADAGFPVLGDIVYGLPSYNRKLQKNYNILRQLLHCRCYSFTDMNGKQVSFEAPLLADMKKLMP